MHLFLVMLCTHVVWAQGPQTLVTALAGEENFDVSGQVWAVLQQEGVSLLLRSEDAGQHWDLMGGPPTDSLLVDAAFSGHTLLLLGEHGNLWQSADAGENWSEMPGVSGLFAHQLAVAGTAVAVASDAGLWVGDVGDSALDPLQSSQSFQAVAWAEDARSLAAVDAAGEVWVSADAGQHVSALGLAGGQVATAVVYSGARLIAGSEDGLWFYAGSWQQCGALPITATGSYASAIGRLGRLSDGRLVAATGQEALFVSGDSCASWSSLASAAALGEVSYAPWLGASTVQAAFRGFAVSGDTAIVGGFNGVAVAQGGADFQVAKLLPADAYQSIFLAPTFPADPRLFVPVYGGGVAWSSDGGRSWDASAVGLGDMYGRELVPMADVRQSRTLFYVGEQQASVSVDDGHTWRTLTVPSLHVRHLQVIGSRVYALGEDAGGRGGRLMFSDDKGANWQNWPTLDALLADRVPESLTAATVGGRSFLVVQGSGASVLASWDEGAQWAEWQAVSADTGAGLVFWPPSAPSRLVVASAEAGLRLSKEGADFEALGAGDWQAPTVAPEGAPHRLGQAPDGSLFLVNRSGQIFRSQDGGDHWDGVSEALAPAIQSMSFSADFAHDGIVVMGGAAGGLWSEDGGESWNPLVHYERFEDQTIHLACVTSAGQGCAQVEETSFGNGGGYRLGVGDRLSLSVQGNAFEVLGATADMGSLKVFVNGVEGDPLPEGASFQRRGLGDTGWKDVVLEVQSVGAEGLSVDAVQAWGSGMPIPIPRDRPDDTGVVESRPPRPDDSGLSPGDTAERLWVLPGARCGCNGLGGVGGLWLFVPASLVLLRRRPVRA